MSEAPRLRVDVRDVACPLTWVRTRVALGRVGEGEAIEVLLLAGEPLENVPRAAILQRVGRVDRKGGPAEGSGLLP